jgi:hypothetical protein
MKFVVSLIKRMANTPKILALAVVLTLAAAAGLFSLFESTGLLDSIYWASTTMTSVGYGDLSPASPSGKILTIAFQIWSLFVLLPCAVANIIDSVRIDEHKMTHAEQEWMFSALETIAERDGISLPAQPVDYE